MSDQKESIHLLKTINLKLDRLLLNNRSDYPPEFWTVKIAAKKLFKCERTIINQIASGEIKAERHGGRKWLIDPRQFNK